MTDPETAADWERQWRSGSSFRAIAAAAGVSDRTVRRALGHLSGARRPGPRKRADVTAEQVAEVYAAVGSIRGTETAMGVSETLVRARLAELGICEHPDQRPRKTP